MQALPSSLTVRQPARGPLSLKVLEGGIKSGQGPETILACAMTVDKVEREGALALHRRQKGRCLLSGETAGDTGQTTGAPGLPDCPGSLVNSKSIRFKQGAGLQPEFHGKTVVLGRNKQKHGTKFRTR